MDVAKDRLYSEAPDSPRRRAVQSVLMNILELLVRVLSPILSFTCDEVWEYIPEALRAGDWPENVQLAAIKDELPGAREEVAKSGEDVAAAMEQLEQDRATLYSNFPGGLKEEDQILYVMDLEDQLDMELMFGRTYDSLSHSEGRDINFAFGVVHPLIQLTDGSILCSVNIDIDFDMSYPEFKQMLRYLAQDERITSINYTKIDYDTANNRVVGYATLLYYYLESDANLYVEPDMNLQPGKDNLFE